MECEERGWGECKLLEGVGKSWDDLEGEGRWLNDGEDSGIIGVGAN